MENTLYLKQGEEGGKTEYYLFPDDVVYYVKENGKGNLYPYTKAYIKDAKFGQKDSPISFAAHMKACKYRKATAKEIVAYGFHTKKSLTDAGFKVATQEEQEIYAKSEGLKPLEDGVK